MARIADLLTNLEAARVVSGAPADEIGEVRDDSRQVTPGDLFVAIPGHKQDGRRFVDEALAKGASAILTEGADAAMAGIAGKATLVLVPSARRALGLLAASQFRAASTLTLTAVTGTNGKTTTTYLLESILAAAGRQAGVVGTLGYRFGGRHREALLTTPGALELFGGLADMAQAGASDVVMEASSIALEQDRLAGCRFRAAALTNVTQDHLDYHGTMARYFAAKTILFRELMAPQTGVSVFFADDPAGRAMRREAMGPVLTLSRDDHGADVAVARRWLGPEGTRLRLHTPAGALDLTSPLVGDFNAANILTAVGLALAHGIAPSAIATGVSRLRGVPGRLEAVANEAGVLCVVDYAHTPDALERALDVLRPLAKGRLLCLFGCGGDRDRGKRPLMGETAARRADITLVTSDNPRTERPQSIIDMILEGVRRSGKPERSAAELAQGQLGFHVEPDRAAAISRAVGVARLGDVLLLAGKGHEDYQIVGTEKSHFDDREVAAAAFAARRGA
ncbi:MAG: UDP-N-acetylmuramoyl-L-alanyl-D-glutamate--2,6-diaminopimelate ligase [Deltaproteobacteria bacterium]|jgi:UDP-N-acetylmuramoyl-L-alanyl-D-glutamate--2,6-diaminopimelate ligase|nr:UDP-N-acetylmuramoyl-L-alanyl-D-glutamate--2,6-diaminopimelate ligase [Deltaproteobacteria bacterium]